MAEKKERRKRDRSPKHTETHPKTPEQRISYIERKMVAFDQNMALYFKHSGKDTGQLAHLSRIGNLAWSIKQIEECAERHILLPQSLTTHIDAVVKAYVGNEEKSIFAEDCKLLSDAKINSNDLIEVIKMRFEQISKNEGEVFP